MQLEWAKSKERKNRDYEYLSELNFQKTRISMSVSTLNSIWQNNKHGIPHISTLNALTRFLILRTDMILRISLKMKLSLTEKLK